MKNTGYDDISVFIEVIRSNGFRAAADKLKLSAGAVSEIIQRVEDRLGTRLIERTTRKMALTEAGQKLYERVEPMIAELQGAFEDLIEDKEQMAGTLRLSAPRSSSFLFLDRVIAEYASQYPDVNIEVIYNDNKVDLVTSGIDAAIRSQTLLEKDTHAIEIGPHLNMVIVATPAYLDRISTPTQPADLINHECICFAFDHAQQVIPWAFRNDSGPYTITPNARIIVNDLTSMINLTKSGAGLAYIYRQPVEPLIQTGELISLFADDIEKLPRYTINYLTKRHMPSRLRAFIDLAKRY